jgi:carbon-monoxide dehydrogenase medium subunit
MYRARVAEALLEGNALSEQLLAAAGRAALQEAAPIDDIRSTAEYRREVSPVLVRRALFKAAERSAQISGEPLPPLK